MKKLVFLIIGIVLSKELPACLILFITTGNEVFVANNEDWAAIDGEIGFQAPQNGKYGYVYFDFASEGVPQGGMNSEGLFFDGTATPYAPYLGNDQKEDCKCYLWTKILKECNTVDKAIAYVKRYKIPEMEKVHIMLADKSGASAIIGVYEKELRIYHRSSYYQLLTNFNIADPSYGGEEPCPRFDTASHMLKRDSTASMKNLEKILSKTTQDITSYSNIYNLTKSEVVVYYLHDFSKKVTFNVSEELKKGNHKKLLSSLFEN